MAEKKPKNKIAEEEKVKNEEKVEEVKAEAEEKKLEENVEEASKEEERKETEEVKEETKQDELKEDAQPAEEKKPKREKKEEPVEKKKRHLPNVMIFGKWDTSQVVITDPGLIDYLNLDPVMIPRSYGRHAKHQFHKSKVNILERLMNKMMIPGHRSKKHLRSSGRCVGKSEKMYKYMKIILKTIEEKTKQNPIQVVVKAIENVALREEITAYQMGGIMVRKAVVTSPQRRVDWSLRLITQGVYQKCFKNTKNLPEVMANELIACFKNDVQNSHALREKERIEREAEGAR